MLVDLARDVAYTFTTIEQTNLIPFCIEWLRMIDLIRKLYYRITKNHVNTNYPIIMARSVTSARCYFADLSDLKVVEMFICPYTNLQLNGFFLFQNVTA